MNKEQDIDRIIDNLLAVTKVNPNDNLWLKIETQITRKNKVSAPTFFITATAVAALLIINVMVISIKKNANNHDKVALEMLYFKSNQLYN